MTVENEPVLKLHLSSIVHGCIRHSTSSEDPINWLNLLRALFKSLRGGKYDLSSKEFVPLLVPVLEALTKLLRSPHGVANRCLFVLVEPVDSPGLDSHELYP